MKDESPPSANVLSIVPQLFERGRRMTPYSFALIMNDTEEKDVWRPSHQAGHLIVKIQTAATYLGFVDPTRDGYGWTAARKTEGDAAFRQLFLHADETLKRCRDIEQRLDRQTRISRTLRARLKAERAKSNA